MVTRANEPWRVWLVGAFALVLALITFPAFKVMLLEHLPMVERFLDTGTGSGRYVHLGLYAGAEAVIVALCLLSVRLEGERPSDIGLEVPRSLAWWLTFDAVCLVAGTIILLRHLEVMTIRAGAGQDYGAMFATNTSQRLLFVAGSALVVPLEEIIWRGFAITRLKRSGLPVWAAVLIPSVAFAYFHGGSIDTIFVSVAVGIGVIGLSVVFVRTRSLSWPILLHFGWNAMLIAVTPS